MTMNSFILIYVLLLSRLSPKEKSDFNKFYLYSKLWAFMHVRWYKKRSYALKIQVTLAPYPRRSLEKPHLLLM